MDLGGLGTRVLIWIDRSWNFVTFNSPGFTFVTAANASAAAVKDQ